MARSRSRPQGSAFDPTLGDRPLAEARQDILVGRWQGARDLLRATGRDWDRRTHRMRLLADAAAGNRTVETWQAAEPANPDAMVLRAETDVMRLFNAVAGGPAPTPGQDALGRDRLDRVVRICLQAAHGYPDDPVPWVSLMTVARLYAGGHPQSGQWWRELQARDRDTREGHHQVLRHLSARWHGSHSKMYDFAWETASFAPSGSPLLALTQAARAEHYRHLVTTGGATDLALSHHWKSDAALRDLGQTCEHWLGHRTFELAQDVADLNFLAHGLVMAGVTDRAREVFALLGNRPTRIPWSYSDDPEELFRRWYERLSR
ncbi:hypothetical protein [Kitasatospora sp. MBT63]|uniref:hypothetical protein n=1 Tax=Kitasatospora sp. MBT63 TaxID=1444768 RepID=UPI00053AD6DB|nr:hypothetical protein [Kitasatospora sp. MBT63]